MASTSRETDCDVPQSLQPALSELQNWIQGLLLMDQEKNTPGYPLYHYSNEAGAFGILGSQELWCFDHLHQTDKTEFSYSLDVAREALQEVARTEDWFEKNFALCVLDLIENNSFTDVFEFYLFSVSRHRDDAGQWERFGDRGRGYAIGFAPHLFFATESELRPSFNENKYVGNALYGEDAIRARHECVFRGAAKIVSKFGGQNASVVKQVGVGLYLNMMAKELIAGQLIWNCLTGKHSKYEDEREVRFLLLGMKGKFDTFRKIHNGKPYVATPLELKQPKSIVEIIVGANASGGADTSIADYLNGHGYTYHIPLFRSQSGITPAPIE